jgi:hypothetical protein
VVNLCLSHAHNTLLVYSYLSVDLMMSQFLFKLQISNDKSRIDFHPNEVSEPLQTAVCEQMPVFLLQEYVLSL